MYEGPTAESRPIDPGTERFAPQQDLDVSGFDLLSADGASVGVALLALAVSIYVAVRQHRDAGRANLTAEWESQEQVVIVNHGPGPARDLSVRATNEQHADGLTAPYVGLYQPLRMTVFRKFGEQAPEIELKWKDNRLRQQHITVTIGEQPRVRQAAKPKSKIEAEMRALAKEEVSAELSAIGRRIGRSRRY